MRWNAARLAAISLAGVLTCLGGCQYLGLQKGNGWAKTNRAGDVERLSPRQRGDVQLSLGRSLENQGNLEGAQRAYREAVQSDPQRAEAYWRLALLKDRQGNVQESAAFYRKALAADPDNPDILCDSGYSLYLQRRWAEAEVNLRQAVKLKPGHQRAHSNLGLLFAQTELADEALSEFRKAGCDEADARANVAFVLTLNRRWVAAREQYELALTANPDSPTAKEGLEKLSALVAKSTARPNSNRIALTSYERPAKSAPETGRDAAAAK